MSDKPLFDLIKRIAGRSLTQAEVDAVNIAIGRTPVAAGPRELSAKGLDLIKSFEGLELTAYKDVVGVLTIGYGSTGPHVKPGMKITEAEALALLRKDVTRFEVAVRRLCPVTTQGQFDGLVSFAFNLGASALEESTLRRKHDAGDYAGAANEFGKWVFAGQPPKRLTGLVRRREAEAALYRGDA